MSTAVHNPELFAADLWSAPQRRPRWAHAIAVMTVLAAVPTLFLGAETTTKGVGMADQRPLVNPAEAFWEILTGQQSGGWVIEHSHRLAGWTVGFCGIVLAISLWCSSAPRWMQWLGTAAVTMIALQGLLGIFRVQLNALLGPSLAWVHGGFAPLVFATLVSVALLTSSRWRFADSGDPSREAADALPETMAWRSAMVVTTLVYLQLLVGGMMRHQPTLLAARGHLLGAFAATTALLWFVKRTWNTPGSRWIGRVILGLLTLQVILGVESWFSWMRRFFVPGAVSQEAIMVHWLRSGHYFIGVCLFAATVALLLRVWSSPTERLRALPVEIETSTEVSG